ncbi:MAG: PQQ-binding-like beta-propeller repeat protein [Candidatus Aegiribacteria sp.]|nr:PQQ-binding-like beta-propeller repeat protein [Candidatus Aegiribacteria sp.]
MHKSHIHAEESIQTSGNGDSRHILIIGVSLIAVLILLFLISTIFNSSGSDGGVAQAVPADSSDTDTLTVIEDEVFIQEMPEFWLQARALPTGNAGWGLDIVAPFHKLWDIRANAGREFFSSPAFVDGVLYFGCNDGNLRAVDALSGSVKWTFGTACGICGEPAVDSETVYFGGQDGVIYALDRYSGNKRWSAGLGYHVFCNTAVLSDTLIVTGNSMGKVCALDARSGEPVWDDEIGGIVLGPVIVNSMAVFSTESGNIVAFDPAGNQLWSRDYSSQASPPSADATGVYAGFSNGVVRKFSLHDGHVIWETDIVSSTSRCVLARPVIVGDVVLSGTNDGQLVSLSASDGTVHWRQDFDNWIQLPPAVGQELVYIACDDQRLHIIDLDTGAKIDSLEMDGYSGTAPLLCSGILYFGNTSGDFIALRGTVPEKELPEILEETPEELPDTVETVEETIEELPDTVETVEETIEELPDTVETVEEMIEDLQETVTEETVVDEGTPEGMVQPLPSATENESESGTDSAETE